MWKQFLKYEISDRGEVRVASSKKEVKTYIVPKTGYVTCFLLDENVPKRFYIHRLVATLFIENPKNKEQVNHKDGNKQNNCVENLEWMTCSENNKHAWETGLNHPAIERKVNQYDLGYNFIRTYKSVAEATRQTGAVKIREVANGKRKTSGGFIWEWVEDFVPQKTGKPKKVAQLDKKTLEIIQVFESISEAARKTGANRKGISAVCLKKQKTCFDYCWKFVEDDMAQ